MIPRRMLWFAGLALCALSCSSEEPSPAGAMGDSGDGGGGGGFTFPVTFLTVASGTVEETVSLSGDVASMRRATLAFERGGRIASMEVEEGDSVKAGQKMAQLNDFVLLAEKEAAVAAQGAAQAQQDYAEQELERSERMADVVADTERDQWSSEVSIRGAVVKQREAEVGRILEQLQQGTLAAPFEGTIVKRHLTLGSYAHPGDPVFDLIDLKHREVRIELPQSLAQQLKPGLAVTVHSTSLADGPIAATLDAVLPSSLSQARTFTGLVRLPADSDLGNQLLPGAFVEVRLISRRAENALVVPADALIESAEGTLLYAIEGDAPPVVRLVPIMILARSNDGIAVAPFEPGTLAAGDRIVVTGTDNVFRGAPLLLHPHRNPSTDDRAVMDAPAEGH